VSPARPEGPAPALDIVELAGARLTVTRRAGTSKLLLRRAEPTRSPASWTALPAGPRMRRPPMS